SLRAAREDAARSAPPAARSRIRRASGLRPRLSQYGVKLHEYVVGRAVLVVAFPAGFLRKRRGLRQRGAAFPNEVEIRPLLGETLLVLERDFNADGLVLELSLLVDGRIRTGGDHFHHQDGLVRKSARGRILAVRFPLNIDVMEARLGG